MNYLVGGLFLAVLFLFIWVLRERKLGKQFSNEMKWRGYTYIITYQYGVRRDYYIHTGMYRKMTTDQVWISNAKYKKIRVLNLLGEECLIAFHKLEVEKGSYSLWRRLLTSLRKLG